MPPKRSNKTARVLNLIAKPEQNIQSSDSIDEKDITNSNDNMSEESISELLEQHNDNQDDNQEHIAQTQQIRNSDNNISTSLTEHNHTQTQSVDEISKSQDSNVVLSDDTSTVFAEHNDTQTQSADETSQSQNSSDVLSDYDISTSLAERNDTQAQSVDETSKSQDSNAVSSDDYINASPAKHNDTQTQSTNNETLEETTQSNVPKQESQTQLPPVPQPVVPILQNVRDQEAQLEDQICSDLLSSLDQEIEKTDQPTVEIESETVINSSQSINDTISNDILSNQNNTQPVKKQSTSENKHYFGAAPHGKRSVRYVNVLQELVEEESIYSSQMLKCHCPRCLADMKALTLTNLPSKYVVIEDDQKNVFMRIYASKYSRLISVQMMRACVMVNENPHH